MKTFARFNRSPRTNIGRLLIVVAAFGTLLAAIALRVGFAAATINALQPPVFACNSGWSTASHWDLGRAPITGDDVVFGTNPSNAADSTDYDLAAGVQLLSLTVANKLSGCSGNFIVTGGPIGLQSGGSITDNWCNLGSDVFPGVTLNGPATFTRGSCVSNPSTLQFSGAVTGTGPLTLANNLDADRMRLTAANSYTGSTTVNGTARVRFDVDGAVPSGSALTVNGSVLFQAASTIGSLAGGGNVFMNGSNALTAGGDNTSTTFSGVYQNSGGAAALTKAGTGTMGLSGVNTYTGATTVNAGKLLVNGSLAAASVVTVNNTLLWAAAGPSERSP